MTANRFSVYRLFAAALVLVLVGFGMAGADEFNPIPDPRAVVRAGNARFTVLTDRLIRMEYSASAQFQDQPTWAFINRLLPVPQYTVSTDGPYVIIETQYVTLRYLSTAETTFNATSLQATIRFNGQTAMWNASHYADQIGNLLGTVRTLDGVDGGLDLDCINQNRADLHCTYGVISRAGYFVYDDTHAAAFDTSSKWAWLANHQYAQPSSAQCQVADADRRDCGYPGISDDQCLAKGCCLAPAAAAADNGIPVCFYSTQADQDLYLFGYGHDYKAALQAFTAVAGPIALPPRYAFGVFYSRYWAYSDQGQMELVREYESRNIPLDVLVTDMDWHITFYKEAAQGVKDQAGQTIGWTGFTWDPHLFPNPDAFLAWCKQRGLRNTLNLHPASGMQPWEEKYTVMAEAMGVDPSSRRYVPFNITDPRFTQNWLSLVLLPLAQAGIDFWWLDWQQGEDWIALPGVNPTFWLNYVFFTDPNRWSDEFALHAPPKNLATAARARLAAGRASAASTRPMLLHRWGGLGNHRYQVGFSGDVVPSWESLAFQPFFTATAANVGYGYWSHDLGGHTRPSPPELYTRWVQWGAFSPMFRTHCTKDALNTRAIWMYPPEHYAIMRAFMRLRAALVPYIYTGARRAYDTGLSLLTPLYYEWPEEDAAYRSTNQYMFGDRVMANPVVAPMTPSTNLTAWTTWLPPGEVWVEWLRGIVHAGGATLSAQYTLDEMPLFVRAGSILPLRTDHTPPLGQAQVLPAALKLLCFPGAATAAGSLYEDDGVSSAFQSGAFARTSFTGTRQGSSLSLTVQPAAGQFDGAVKARAYDVRFIGSWPASAVTVNGAALPYCAWGDDEPANNCWTYDGSELTLVVKIVTPMPTDAAVTVAATVVGDLADPLLTAGVPFVMRRFNAAKELLDNQWGLDTVYQEDYASLIDTAETGRRISAAPQTAGAELAAFVQRAQAGLQQAQALSLQPEVQKLLIAQLSDAVQVLSSRLL